MSNTGNPYTGSWTGPRGLELYGDDPIPLRYPLAVDTETKSPWIQITGWLPEWVWLSLVLLLCVLFPSPCRSGDSSPHGKRRACCGSESSFS